MRRRRRRCLYCASLFLPHPAVGARQKSCGTPDCDRQREVETRQAWVAKNPGYFRGRYRNSVEPWLREHPGYLKDYRRRRRRRVSGVVAESVTVSSLVSARKRAPADTAAAPERQRRTRLSDIQDELIALSRSVTGIMAHLGLSDIQDELTLSLGIQSGKEAI